MGWTRRGRPQRLARAPGAIASLLFIGSAMYAAGGSASERGVTGHVVAGPRVAQAAQLGDEQIRRALQGVYRRSDVVRTGRDALRVQVHNGVVLLSGSVGNLLAEERAVEIAERTRGVRDVVNRIEVKTPRVSDEELQRRVAQALASDPGTEGLGVRARVRDQVVLLSGDVSSWQERALAADVVRAIEGVREVRNRVGVEYAQRRSDEQIKSDILARLRMDAWIDADRVDVRVDDGRVRLSGAVSTPRERAIAREDAWVLGVRSVSAEDLEVAPRTSARLAEAALSDEQIAQGVRRSLAYDPRVDASAVNAEVEAGVVTLTGTVDNVRARRTAVQIARGTTGVDDVVDYLQVRANGRRLGEDETADTVRRAIRYNPYVDLDDIEVTVRNGVAYLTGSAETWFARQQAEVAASTVRGVREVVNNVGVQGAEDAVTDDEIQDAVEAQLMWSPFVDSDRIDVAVQRGIATLTGTVGSQRERLAAEENAREGGAYDVVNLIRVRSEGRAAAE